MTKTINKLLNLYELPINELLEKANRITAENFGNEVEFCSIISAKTGKCTENCRYCAQSSHYRTDIETHPLLSVDEVRDCAISARKNGVSRFAIVTSGKIPDSKDFDKLLEMIQAINTIEGMQACASIGILDEERVTALKDAGLVRYHHNLNSSMSYYKDVCTTHSFEERINTLRLCQKHGIEICAGGIIGMGETRKQRVEMALELAELNPESVPVNFLHPIAGTPFEVHKDAIDEEEILKTLAVYRIILPKSVIRFAGGRFSRFSKKNQELGLIAGVNGILVGNYLTTIGITLDEDMILLDECGKSLI